MEERSLWISKQMAATADIDPAFAAVYRAHLEDEVRHVQTDWHLLERFWLSRPAWVRRANANLLEAFVVGLFLRPRRANVRLVGVLVSEFPRASTAAGRTCRGGAIARGKRRLPADDVFAARSAVGPRPAVALP